MTIFQRQIVEVEFRLPPDGTLLRHPCIVLSNTAANDEEQGFVGVMLTSQAHYQDDIYSFEIDDDMLTKPHGRTFVPRACTLFPILFMRMLFAIQDGETRCDFFISTDCCTRSTA